MTKADRVFREEMRKLRALRKRVKRDKALAAAKARPPRQAKAQRRYWAERRARERAETTLTSATVRDVMAMDRDFREAVSE